MKRLTSENYELRFKLQELELLAMDVLESAPAMSPLTKRKICFRPKIESLRLSSKIINMPSASAPDAVDFTSKKSPSQAGNEFTY